MRWVPGCQHFLGLSTGSEDVNKVGEGVFTVLDVSMTLQNMIDSTKYILYHLINISDTKGFESVTWGDLQSQVCTRGPRR